jgi:cathepsin L
MKAVLVAVLLFASALALSEVQYQDAFVAWMNKHHRSYSHEDFFYRYRVFKKNLDFVNAHNAAEKGYTVAMNRFADMTNQEFSKLYLGTLGSLATVNAPISAHDELHLSKLNVNAPANFDWRTEGAVTPVKNQGQCGSCWTFSTTGSTEGCHFLKTKKLVGLSEQNLVDCVTADQGCNGGLMTDAMTYIIKQGGIDTEASYPYTAEDGTCQWTAKNVGATLASFTNVQTGSESDLLAKATLGPVSVAIDASQDSFQLYESGVYNEPLCENTSQSLDHGVLVVGWGVTSNGTDYWIVKNSWGTDWGLEGYIWMSRNLKNQCGIATMATLPSC